jgi:exodeoxyribonuclease V alpha subunit
MTQTDIQLDPTQLAAVEHAATSKFSIITGGAGTGKTTIIKEIYDRLNAQGKSVYLCAFAGKAAARLKEATKQETSTIHRMLGYNGVGFTLETLSGRHVVVDEASMVDSELMAAIINRKPASLTLVGDSAQLPPVGKGQPFHDIIALRPEIVYNLTVCYRNSEAVFQAATAIRSGGHVGEYAKSDAELWRLVNTGSDAATHRAIMAKVKAGFFDFDQDIILCPKNGTDEAPATVKGLNADIAQIVLPRKPHEAFVVGDRVMNTKNLPEKDIWNGTTGKVIAVDIDGGVRIKLDEPVLDWTRSTSLKAVYKDEVRLTKAEVKNLELAYAISVHKSQGSQYRRVCFVCLTRDSYALLDRSLIYTAVTRTRSECYVVGDRRAFYEGCRKVKGKATVLQQLAAGEVA